ncbi:MAG: ribulose-phosphate 3-epimerase [Candidatus Diapherotrites archaeon]
MKKKVLIAPSILSADFGKLNSEIKEVEPYCDLIHVDVMDGVFVPNITFGQAVLKKIKSKKPLDVHLMIIEPEKFVKEFAEAGAKIISFHVEASKDARQTINLIRKAKAKPALAIKPKTPLTTIEPFLEEIDFVLLMTVEPGFGGQNFLKECLDKIKELRRKKPELDIEVDGGINSETAKPAVQAGANILVAGSAIFGEKNRKKAIMKIKKAIKEQKKH